MDTPGIFWAVFYKEDNFYDFLFGLLQIKPFLKEVSSKMKEFAPKGSQFLLLKVDFVQKGDKTSSTVLSSMKVYQFSLIVFRWVPITFSLFAAVGQFASFMATKMSRRLIVESCLIKWHLHNR